MNEKDYQDWLESIKDLLEDTYSKQGLKVKEILVANVIADATIGVFEDLDGYKVGFAIESDGVTLTDLDDENPTN